MQEVCGSIPGRGTTDFCTLILFVLYIYIYRKKERNEVTSTIYFSPVALSLITALQQERHQRRNELIESSHLGKRKDRQ